ncbi:hypothetical protein EDD91_7605 [Streptomyces sp. KS 21]|nr:hypothetical protein EDD91_7605 [Streptomyces sp. KS 21]
MGLAVWLSVSVRGPAGEGMRPCDFCGHPVVIDSVDERDCPDFVQVLLDWVTFSHWTQDDHCGMLAVMTYGIESHPAR